MLMRATVQTESSNVSIGGIAQVGRAVSSHPLTDSFDLMGAPMPFTRNAEIYGETEPADYLYKVISGTVRTYKVLSDGRRQIGAFYLPGDVFGFEIGAEHAFSAEAITNATVLVVKRSAVTALAERDDAVARQLLDADGT